MESISILITYQRNNQLSRRIIHNYHFIWYDQKKTSENSKKKKKKKHGQKKL